MGGGGCEMLILKFGKDLQRLWGVKRLPNMAKAAVTWAGK